MSIQEIAGLQPSRVCNECVSVSYGTSVSEGISVRPSPYLAPLLAAKRRLDVEGRARLLLAGSESDEVSPTDIRSIVQAHSGSDTAQTLTTSGWLLLARNWRYAPLGIPRLAQRWVNLGWHDPSSQWSLLPVNDPRPGALQKLRPAMQVHATVRGSHRWPHPGRHGLTRAAGGPLWAAFSALEPYRPIWLKAVNRGQGVIDMRKVCETFMIISNLSSARNVLDLDLAHLWEAAHSLS